MPYCSHCGILINGSAIACSSCGASSQMGIPSNIAGILSYLFAPVSGIVFLLIAPYKHRSFVRFHAFQSLFFCASWIGSWVFVGILTAALDKPSSGLIGFITLPIDAMIGLIALAYWIFLMYSTYSGRRYQLPVLGRIAEQRSLKPKQ